MKDNKHILNEAFFKKARPSRKEALNLPQYEPVEAKSKGGNITGTYQVTDADEVKRRLSGTFGVMFGNNSVRSMASRAIKQFPILVSDNVSPETVVSRTTFEFYNTTSPNENYRYISEKNADNNAARPKKYVLTSTGLGQITRL